MHIGFKVLIKTGLNIIYDERNSESGMQFAPQLINIITMGVKKTDTWEATKDQQKRNLETVSYLTSFHLLNTAFFKFI